MRRHFSDVLSELDARDVGGIAPHLRRARQSNLGVLRAYADRGIFPKNQVAPGRFVPCFIDGDGTICAVGNLLAASGWLSAADRIAARERYARVMEMRSPELGAWVAQSGLSIEECSRIQPMYCCGRTESYYEDPDPDAGDAGDAGPDAGPDLMLDAGHAGAAGFGGAAGMGGVGGVAGSGGVGGAAGGGGLPAGGGFGGAGAGGTGGVAGQGLRAPSSDHPRRLAATPALSALGLGLLAIVVRRERLGARRR